MDARTWRVERVTEGARELIAHGKIDTCQDFGDVAISIATRVGQVIKRGMPTAQAVGWIDLATATGRRYEDRYEVGFEWFEIREVVYDLLCESGTTAVIHARENLHITISEPTATQAGSPPAKPTVTVSIKVAEDGMSLQGPQLCEVWLPGFKAGHIGAHGTKWRRYSRRTNRMTGEYHDTPEAAAKAVAAGWGDNANADIEIVDHTPAREEPQP